MGIYIAAAIASTIAIVLCGSIALRITDPAQRRVLLAAFVLMLPMQPLAFYAVRLPILGLLQPALGAGAVMIAISLLAAPLTEEPAKWLALSLKSVRRAIASGNAMGMAIAAGLGFGIGEIWFLAEQLARLDAIKDIPSTEFSGFMIERVGVCLLHGLLLVPLFHAIAIGRGIALGAFIGMLAHLLANLPVLVLQSDLFGLGRVFWGNAIMLWLLAMIVAGLYALNVFSGRRLVRGYAPAVAATGE